MNLSRKYKPREDIVFREEDEGAFVFDPETGNLKYMNRSGRETYRLLNGRNDLDQVVHSLSRLYPDAESHQLENDVEAFVTDLEKGRFVSCLHENEPT